MARVVEATISEDVSTEKARKEIQELIEKGILKDAGYDEVEG